MGKIIITLLIIAALFFLFVFSGIYNVSARKKDPAFVDWILSTVSEHSVERHSKSEEILILTDTAIMMSTGKNLYDNNCVICHGGPEKKTVRYRKRS